MVLLNNNFDVSDGVGGRNSNDAVHFENVVASDVRQDGNVNMA